MRLIATVLAVGLLSACTQGYYVKHRSPISVSKHVKRLNTTVCHDKDDWYLDGYRVGKDFQAQSQSQLKNKKVRLILTALFLFKEYRVIQLQTLGVRMVG